MPASPLAQLVSLALAEDVGDGDVTTEATVPAEARARATVVQKQDGVISGLDAAELVLTTLSPAVSVVSRGPEGEWRAAGAEVLVAEGPARALLTGERTALNFLMHLSGIATRTARAVASIEGTGARLLDTRKTTPGMRALEKAAVAHGGGVNHRHGLYDMVFIKENHLEAAGGVTAAIERARAHPKGGGLPLLCECETLAEVDEALEAGAERLLLDNMAPDALREAVARVAGRAVLEASGGISLEALRAYAETGVDFLSLGTLTHSAPALDLSLRLETLP